MKGRKKHECVTLPHKHTLTQTHTGTRNIVFFYRPSDKNTHLCAIGRQTHEKKKRDFSLELGVS